MGTKTKKTSKSSKAGRSATVVSGGKRGGLSLLTRKINKWVAIGLFVIVFGAVGSYFVFASHAANIGYTCGTTCEGHSYNWINPASQIDCSKSQIIVGSGHPTKANITGAYGTFDDPYMKITMYYSTTCQTMWATIQNTKAIGRASCDYNLWRFIPVNWAQGSQVCPAAGTAPMTTRMVDDFSPTSGKAASFTFTETMMNNGPSARYTFSY